MEVEDGVGGLAGPLPCTSIAVDNFEVKYAERVSVYFLTHMHAGTIVANRVWSMRWTLLHRRQHEQIVSRYVRE